MKKPPLGRSLGFALAGIYLLFKRERNARIELALGFLALGFCAVYRVSSWEWAAVLLSCAVVLSLEAMNAALEALADALHPQRSPGVGLAKDMAAASVLIGAGLSALVGLWIFGPRILGSLGLL